MPIRIDLIMFNLNINEENRHFSVNVRGEKYNNSSVNLVAISSIDEKDFRISNRYRTVIKRIGWAMYRDFREKARIYGRAIIHNIGNTQSQIKHTTERYTRKIDYGFSYQERVKQLADILSNNDLEGLAKDLIDLNQRATDLDAQLVGINLLVGKEYDLEPEEHPLRELILRCAIPAKNDLRENRIYLDVSKIEDLKIKTDFRLFNCAMYHFFDNLKKYTIENSQVSVTYDDNKSEITFDMVSRAIEKGEESKIFQEGFCGTNSHSLKGEGLGMFIFYLVFSKMGAIPKVTFDATTRRSYDDGNSYQKNMFSIHFPVNTIYR